MVTALKMRRLNDGLRLSKGVAQVMHEALLDDPQPRRKVSAVPRNFKPATEGSVNQFGVTKGQVWESMDPRDLVDGEPRLVCVVTVGDSHALVENMKTGVRTSISLKSFSGRNRKSFKLAVNAGPLNFTDVAS